MKRNQIQSFKYVSQLTLSNSYAKVGGNLFSEVCIYHDEGNDITYQIFKDAPYYRYAKDTTNGISDYGTWQRLNE